MTSRRNFIQQALKASLIAAAAPSIVSLCTSVATAAPSFGTVLLDLSQDVFLDINTVGGSVIYELPWPHNSTTLLIIRETKSLFSVLTAVCTHKFCILNEETSQSVYNPNTGLITCSCHGSEYDVNGVVVTPQRDNQPNLDQYQHSFDEAANTLTVVDAPLYVSPLSKSNFRIDSIYPNPFVSTFTIEYYLPTTGSVAIHLSDEQGNTVDAPFNALVTSGTQSVLIDGSKLASGIYFCRLTTTSGTLVRKIVKQ